ncbi:glycosyltransferase family 4 protein [Chitinibacter sp. S2-10]|uniref:glycosyltransferase family 4 protein n=1 Tax=Chitinibacter sp. S2-10 TaxID=3373597 RepID=UPI003977A4D6
MINVLAFSLGRLGGCVVYATNIINNFSQPHTAIVSRYCNENVPCAAVQVPTFRSMISFVFSTLFYLPMLTLWLLPSLLRHRVYYFPYYHPWNPWFIACGKLLGKASVVTVHDAVFHPGEGTAIEQWLMDASVKWAAKIIVLSMPVEVQLRQRIDSKLKIHVIPHGLIVPDGLICKPRQWQAKPNIAFLGRVNAYKGVQLLVDAVAGLDDSEFDQLLIAGRHSVDIDYSGIPDQKKQIIDRWLEDGEIAAFANQCHILALPYIEASQSGVATIAIAANIPVIATRVGALPDQLKGGAIYCDATVDGVRAALCELIHSDLRYQECVSALINEQMELSWAQIAAQVEFVLCN